MPLPHETIVTPLPLKECMRCGMLTQEDPDDVGADVLCFACFADVDRQLQPVTELLDRPDVQAAIAAGDEAT